ncbi:MAG: AsmA family protein [Deltaproteobacteria bacterium]|nr:AsmA family protein [Deltaproteobacteria bacterium]
MSKAKKILIGLASVVVVVVVVVVIAALTLDPQALIAAKKDALLKDLSTKIGREVTSGDVTTRVGASLGATIQGVRLAGPAVAEGQPASKPQLEIGQVDVQLSLLRALISFGKDLHVTRFTVDGLVVRAARDTEGVWNFQDVVDRLEAAKDPSQPEEKTEPSALQGLRIANVLVRNGRVELDDAVLGRPLAIGELNVGVSDVVLGDPLAVWIKANLEDAGKKSPIDLNVRLAQLPKDLSFDPLPDLDVKAIVTDVDLGPWGGLLPADAPAPVAGVLRADLTTKLTKNTEVVDVAGSIITRGLVLRDAVGKVATKAERLAAPRGTPLDLDVVIGLHMDPEQTRLEKLKVNGSGVVVDGTLTSKGSGLAGLQAAAVTAKIADVHVLLAALPPSLRGLPPELDIKGPLDATLSKTGEALTGNVVLDAARVSYSSKDEKTGVTSLAFDKAPGKPLNLKLAGKADGKTLTIDDFALVVDTFKLGGKLVVPQGEGALTADIHSGAIGLSSLQGLVPPFREAIGKGQKVEGTVSIDISAKAVGAQQEATIDLGLKGLDVNLASMIVKGSGGVDVKASPAGKDVTIVAKADLDGLSIQKISEGETALNKPAGLPLRFDVDVKKGETNAVINSAKLVIGKSAISGKGTVDNIGKANESMNLDFGAVDVAFNDLRQALPGAGKLPAGGRMKGALALKGGLSANALALEAKNVDVAFGNSHLAGTVLVKNFDTPVLNVDLPTVALAFDDVRPLSEATSDLPVGGRFDGSVSVNGDTARKSSVTLDVKIARLIAARSDLKGTIRVTDLDKPKFVMSTTSDFLDVDGLRAAFGGGGDDEPKGPKKPRENPHGLSKSTREMLAGVSGKATLIARRALVKEMEMTNFNGVLVMNRGKATFEKLEFGFYGGTVSATGTSLDLPPESTRYDINFDGKNIDFGKFLAEQSPMGKVFKGVASAELHVKGRGLAKGDFALTAEGPAMLSFKSLSIGSLDMLGPINDALKKSGKVGGVDAAKASSESGLTLSNFSADTFFKGGKMNLKKPIDADTPLGKMKTDGGWSLDGSLDFKSTLMLSPATIAKMTGGKVKPKDAIPLPMKIGGTWDKPRITGLEIDKLVVAIAGEAAKDLLDKGKDAIGDKAKDAIGDKAKDALGDLLGGDKKKKKKKK